MRVRELGLALLCLVGLFLVSVSFDVTSSYALQDESHLGGADCTHSEISDDIACETATGATGTCEHGNYQTLSDLPDAGKDYGYSPNKNACRANNCKYKAAILYPEATEEEDQCTEAPPTEVEFF